MIRRLPSQPEDITDPLLERVLDLLPDAVFVVDEAGRIVMLNNRVAPMLGFPDEELLGKSIEALIPERYRAAHQGHRSHFHGHPSARRMGTGMALTACRKDGSEIPVDVGLAPLLTAHGVRVLAVMRDISERQRYAELERRLAHADRLVAVGRLAAGVAHEINAPAAYVMANLTAARDMLTEIEAALETGDPIHAQAMLQVLHSVVDENLEGMDRIRRIVGELQGFSRIDGSGVTETDLNDVVEAATRIVQSELKHKALLELEPGEVPRIVADGARLGQVVVDLLVNALQALPEGREGNRIRVTTRTEDGEVVLTIQDNGQGMDEETRRRAFEPFFTTKTAGTGTGLGLALCADIVHKHGGSISLHSSLGDGTRAEVRLPLDTGLTVREPDRPEATPRHARSARILIIDDEPHMLEAFDRLLGRSHSVVVARGGQAGLDVLARDTAFDVILCDLMMAGLDGIQVYERLEDTAPELLPRLVFTSGGAYTARSRRFLDTVDSRVLRKPVDVAELRRVIADTLEGRF